MIVVLSNAEVIRLQKEIGVKSLRDLEIILLRKIPNKYHHVLQFKELPSGSLGIHIRDQCLITLISILNPKTNGNMSKLVKEWNRIKGKLIISNPMLIFLASNIEREINKSISLMK